METVKIGEKEVEIPNSWLEVTFDDFIRFTKLVNSQKTEEQLMKEYIDDEDEIMALKLSIDNINFNTKVASFWSGLSEEEISLCSLEEVEAIIKAIDFLNEQYTPIALDKFKFEGETYILPKAGMREENFGTYIEAEQVELNNKRIESGNLDFLPRQIAILCKKEGEKAGLIKEEVIQVREKLFRQLDMATVWDVAFFLHSQEKILMKLFLTSPQMVETLKQLSQQKTQSQATDG